MEAKKKKRKPRRLAKTGTLYTPEEVEFIKKWYGRKPVTRIAKSIKRTVSSVNWKITDMGLERVTDYWTPQEIQRLKCLWGTMTSPEIAKELGRSLQATRAKAYDMKLSKERKIAYDDQGRRRSMKSGTPIAWSQQMLDDLDRMFPNTKNADLVEFFGLSQRTIIRQARKRGLQKDPSIILNGSKDGLAKGRLTNMVRGNSGQFKKGVRSNPAGEFGSPTGNKSNWQKRKENEIQAARISEESNTICEGAPV